MEKSTVCGFGEDVREIGLSQGFVALVDEEDFVRVSEHGWYAARTRHYVYAVRREKVNGVYKTTSMHRFILGALPGEYIDHINHDTLDNRRSNLRRCLPSENMFNKVSTVGVSKYKGVVWDKQRGKWLARIGKEYKQYCLGYFVVEEDAARAYNERAKELFGEFAHPNEIEEIV
jgi:hypothetical protein